MAVVFLALLLVANKGYAGRVDLGDEGTLQTDEEIYMRTLGPDVETNQACRVLPRDDTCKGWQKERCPLTCAKIAANLSGDSDEDGIEEDSDGVGEISLISIAADIDSMNRFDLIKLMKNHAWARIWPKTCDGTSTKGQKLDFDIDGFVCDSKRGTVGRPAALMWGEGYHYCCQGSCSPSTSPKCLLKGGSKIEAISLQEAARRAATGMPRVETKSGVQVEVNEPTQDFNPIDGVKAMREIRMMGDTLQFKTGEAIFEPKSDTFLAELSKPLSVLISLQLTSMQETGEDLKVLFCTHATTTASNPDNVRKIDDVPLPNARANALKTRLEEFIGNGISNGVAVVGDGMAHYKPENPDMRFGSILYKIYDAKAGSPSCQEEDLNLFL